MTVRTLRGIPLPAGADHDASGILAPVLPNLHSFLLAVKHTHALEEPVEKLEASEHHHHEWSDVEDHESQIMRVLKHVAGS